MPFFIVEREGFVFPVAHLSRRNFVSQAIIWPRQKWGVKYKKSGRWASPLSTYRQIDPSLPLLLTSVGTVKRDHDRLLFQAVLVRIDI